MAILSPNIDTRINILNTVLSKKEDQQAVEDAVKAAGGDWSKAQPLLQEKLPPASLKKVMFTHKLAELTDDNVGIVTAIAKHRELKDLRDVALHYDDEHLAALIDPEQLPESIPGASPEEKKAHAARVFQHRLFEAEPSAVLQRMLQDAKVPIADPAHRSAVAKFLDNQPDFNIRTTSIYHALQRPDAFKDIAADQRPEIAQHLKTLQRVQAVSPVPEAVPVLMKANLTSAFRIAEMPESAFLNAHADTLGEHTARQVYTNAVNVHIRNEQALITMREAVRGSGLAIIDGLQPKEERLARLQAVVKQKAVPLNLETLFGSLDYCECDDCLSVYSPASYFVEILQYLRNNNLDPKNPNTGKDGIVGTPLEKLFRRRPDLGCLELTCENTFTVLPYIDLVNEVMESFVVHLDKYKTDPNFPKQAVLEVFNVEDETSSELLAQPQHINYLAYCILKNAVYPFTLPYHQAIDAIRIFLKYFGTSRYNVQDMFRTSKESCDKLTLSDDQKKYLQVLHAEVMERAVDAEFLGLTQEEYIILTREAFWPKTYFDLTLQMVHSVDDYQAKIGVRPIHEYYGYGSEADMLSIDENPASGQKGLTFVKKQFLPRTRIQYTDLVDLLKTQYINPAYPQGSARLILESIRFSYRFLQTLLVDTGSSDPKVRFAKLIDFLNTMQPLVPQVLALLHPDPCHQHLSDACVPKTDFHAWVYCYFERIGKLIVLESGEGPRLPIDGDLFTRPDLSDSDNPPLLVGHLQRDGLICSTTGEVIGKVTITGQVVDLDAKPFVDKFPGHALRIADAEGEMIGWIDEAGISNRSEESVSWLPSRDTCNLDIVRLKHLDGSALTADEYDRMQRFLRLWLKLGWSIDETDQALAGLFSKPGRPGGGTTEPGACQFVGFDAFKDDCAPGDGADSDSACPPCDNGGGSLLPCPNLLQIEKQISPAFLHQLVAVRKLQDMTGLPLAKLLVFWSDIGTAGEKSLYARLFLTHNLLAIDKVFKPDANGNVLTQAAKISEHMPVLMAALKLKAEEIKAIVALLQLPDALTLPNVSELYRHSLLAKLLHVKTTDLSEVIGLFGDPFQSAWATLGLLKVWGSMEDAGFTFRQLNYLVRGHDDPLRPQTPPQRTILQISKTLYDGLNGIDYDHPDIPADKKDQATADLIRAKAALLYEASVVEGIMGLLEGSTVYTTNAPAKLSIAIPEGLAKKFKYANRNDAVPPAATIQVTGILTDTEKTQAKALSPDPAWAKAIDRAGKQALQFFNDTLFGIFPNADEARAKLLASDVNVPFDPENPAAADANTASEKRFYFAQYFLPFLRRRLAHRLIVGTNAGASGLSNDISDLLLSDILLIGMSGQHAIAVLEQIHQKPPVGGSDWKGYLIPAVDDAYTLIATSLVGEAQPPELIIDGRAIAFSVQQEDPSNVWSTDPAKPIPLKGGKLYWIEVNGQPATSLQWKTAAAPKAPIPASALLPDYSSSGTAEVFVKLQKTALLVNGFSLGIDELRYWQARGADFADDGKPFDVNAVTLGHWRRLQAYAGLRDKLPQTASNLLSLFEWASKPGDASELSERIAAVTLWKKEAIEKLIAPENFDLKRRDAFRNEVNLLKLQQAMQIADATGADIDRLFAWANPSSKFSVCHRIAEEIRAVLRARFDQEDWEQVVKPLNDQLREDQKLALIAYLLVQQDLVDWGVVDADSLFEFFLIDVQMDACLETSRIKQAISSVQLFIQRCLLGLEAQYGVAADVLDRERWNWMQKYRVWEANRKVFLYPENWIKSELRDDKSPFYKELESELLQKDINTQTVEDALKNYLFKVDQVANLSVVGLHLEQEVDKDGKPIADLNGKPVYLKLHVFGRTQNAPYFFYYRYFQVAEKNWYPWDKVQVDIPSYDLEQTSDTNQVTIVANGSYLAPAVWNKRLMIFFAQIVKKTAPKQSSIGSQTFKEVGDNKASDHRPVEYLEIKLAWSEYRNGKWTPKQVSSDAVYDLDHASTVQRYRFAPRIMTGADARVVVEVFWSQSGGAGDVLVGKFHFTGSQLFKGDPSAPLALSGETDFQVNTADRTLHSLQAVDAESPPPLMGSEPYFKFVNDRITAFPEKNGTELRFYHPFVHDLLGKLAGSKLDAMFDYYLNQVPDDNPFVPHKADAFGGDAPPVMYHELKRAYSLYNWEAAFHAPMLLVDRLMKAQQFDQALTMCHYVLDPYAKGSDDKRFWKFFPFKEIDAENVLEKLFLGLQPNQPNPEINEWRDKPFQPHVVARSRPSAYMKWVAMKYIEILIAYGDFYFRQNTLETVPLAIQCYVLASHVYGPRGQKIPKRGKTQPQTYNSLLDKWDAFGNAMVELELAFPFSNQTQFPIGFSNGVVGLANVFGFATTLYFCIPDNPQLRALRDTIDDRLFKIRHCQDIEGVFRKLPLFEPPIEPGLLVQAAAQGLSLASVLNELNSPMPNYRFTYLLQKALELCGELKGLSNSFLSIREKGDAEALAQLRARHDSSIQTLMMEMKKLQLDEAGKALDALQQSRKAPVYRLQHSLRLIGEDLGKVPDGDNDFAELPDQIEAPVEESGMKLIPFEKEELDKAGEAASKQEDIGSIEVLASILNIIPSFSVDLKPIGIGAGASFGGSNLGSAAQAMARSQQIVVANRTHQSTSASRKAGFLRQLQDRVQQANIAGYEIKNIDKQALIQKIRIDLAQQDIINQQKQIDNAQEVEEFLRSKYTNGELYAWMDGEIRTLYHQAYTLAYDLAKRAEKVFRFERGLSTSNFIEFGYWDVAHDGLLSGERLYVGLKQLEAAYQEKRGHDFEITKAISLRLVNPLALIQLKETGACEFALPEILFDMDYPGHYLRRIKSVGLRIPCVLGPYTSLNCTLRLTEHKFRTSAIAKSKGDYPEQTDQADERFSTTNVPITAIAVSSLDDENGVFELNFHDERYLPFEGAGAISKWRISLPDKFRQFDYDTIADVIVRLRYTAVDGGDKLKKPASDTVLDYIKSVEDLSREEGLFAAFDLKNDFPNEWYSANHPPAGATERVLTIDKLFDKLPLFTKGRPPSKIKAADISLFVSGALTAASITATQGGNDISFTDGKTVGAMKSFVAKDVGAGMDSLQVRIHDTTTAIDKMWLLERYVLA